MLFRSKQDNIFKIMFALYSNHQETSSTKYRSSCCMSLKAVFTAILLFRYIPFFKFQLLCSIHFNIALFQYLLSSDTIQNIFTTLLNLFLHKIIQRFHHSLPLFILHTKIHRQSHQTLTFFCRIDILPIKIPIFQSCWR